MPELGADLGLGEKPEHGEAPSLIKVEFGLLFVT